MQNNLKFVHCNFIKLKKKNEHHDQNVRWKIIYYRSISSPAWKIKRQVWPDKHWLFTPEHELLPMK